MRVQRGLRASASLMWLASVLAIAPTPPPAARGLAVHHSAGQTWITWESTITPDLPADPTIADVQRARLAAAKVVLYRVYRADHPITTTTGLTRVAEIEPLSGWNTAYAGRNKLREPALRYVISNDGVSLPPDRELVVLMGSEGTAYYAVTEVRDGRERVISSEERTATPVIETRSTGLPVLQREEKNVTFAHVPGATTRHYVRWEPTPESPSVARAFDYLVALPPAHASHAAVGIHLHGWGGSMRRGFGWWQNAASGAILLAPNQDPYDWWTGYHERYWDSKSQAPARRGMQQAWQNGVVRPYTQQRILSFVDWMRGEFAIDPSRTFTAGSSMGGSGALMLAFRHPDRIAWAVSWVGVHTPAESPRFRRSYELVFGKPEWNVKFEDGTPVWRYFDDAAYLLADPARETGFVTFSNGKNDDGIGWSQAAQFLHALQQTRRPHLFVWGQRRHNQRAVMPVSGAERDLPLDLTTAQSLPAFTAGSLDDDPGDGTPASGRAEGQINAYLAWTPASIVDEANRWEIEVRLIDRAPAGVDVVDVTPRRCQAFRPAPGQRLRWTATPRGGTQQAGVVVADRWGLVTLPRVAVGKSPVRIRVVADGRD